MKRFKDTVSEKLITVKGRVGDKIVTKPVSAKNDDEAKEKFKKSVSLEQKNGHLQKGELTDVVVENKLAEQILEAEFIYSDAEEQLKRDGFYDSFLKLKKGLKKTHTIVIELDKNDKIVSVEKMPKAEYKEMAHSSKDWEDSVVRIYESSDTIDEAKYNIEIHGGMNPYKDVDKAALKRKAKSFSDQISDLRSKVQNANLGSGGNKKAYFEEIDTYQLKLDQVNYILKGK